MASTSLINCTPQKMMSPPALMNNSPPFGNCMPMNSTPNRLPAKRSIQPAAASVPVGHSSSAAKKRIQFSSLGYVLPPPPPASVARRNARERNRVKQVNMGFAILRQHIPSSFGSSRPSSASSGSKSRKVSKVDTLRCAVEYIRSLQELLDDNENASTSSASSTSSENMSPPANVHSSAKQSFTYGSSQPTHHHHSGTSLSPSCSDASSPTPSYGSEHSYFTASSWDPYDNYDAYEAPDLQDAAPNDDELLDAISWWQQSQ